MKYFFLLMLLLFELRGRENNKSEILNRTINTYTVVEAFLCGNRIRVSSSTGFAVGNAVIIIQMQGATINRSNTSQYGDVNVRSAGNYELNYIAKIEGNEILLRDQLVDQDYDLTGKVQLVSVPQFGNARLGNLTCKPWNGTTGGVLAFIGGEISLSGDIDASGKGFRKGIYQQSPNNGCPHRDSFFFPINLLETAGQKGEGIVERQFAYWRGRGKEANGGGGGNDHNNGGAGGGNFGPGGDGGIWTDHGNCNQSYSFGGKGGIGLPYNNSINKIFMGGGGGAGHSNNGSPADGANGGGIIIILADHIRSNGYFIRANGDAAVSSDGIDGGGGGGAGGTVLIHLKAQNPDRLNVSVKGGNGASISYRHGPGGGGGGGVLWMNRSLDIIPLLRAQGGQNGTDDHDERNRASRGRNGILINNLNLSRSNKPFIPTHFLSFSTSINCDGTTRLQARAAGSTSPLRFSIDEQNWNSTGIFDSLSADTKIFLSDGCMSLSSTAQIELHPEFKVDLSFIQHPSCDSLGRVKLDVTGNVGAYRVRMDQNDSWTTIREFYNLFPNFYLVEAEDSRGCMDQIELELVDQSYDITIDLPEFIEIGRYEQLALDLSPYPLAEPLEIEWTPPSPSLDCTDCLTPVFSPTETTEYHLFLKDHYGCMGTFMTTIKVVPQKIYIPNAVSFNGDGRHDVFFPHVGNPAIIGAMSMTIFDRWGNILYRVANVKSFDESNGWNGSYQAHAIPAGAYPYLIEIEFSTGDVEQYKGDVNVFR